MQLRPGPARCVESVLGADRSVVSGQSGLGTACCVQSRAGGARNRFGKAVVAWFVVVRFGQVRQGMAVEGRLREVRMGWAGLERGVAVKIGCGFSRHGEAHLGMARSGMERQSRLGVLRPGTVRRDEAGLWSGQPRTGGDSPGRAGLGRECYGLAVAVGSGKSVRGVERLGAVWDGSAWCGTARYGSRGLAL